MIAALKARNGAGARQTATRRSWVPDIGCADSGMTLEG